MAESHRLAVDTDRDLITALAISSYPISSGPEHRPSAAGRAAWPCEAVARPGWPRAGPRGKAGPAGRRSGLLRCSRQLKLSSPRDQGERGNVWFLLASHIDKSAFMERLANGRRALPKRCVYMLRKQHFTCQCYGAVPGMGCNSCLTWNSNTTIPRKTRGWGLPHRVKTIPQVYRGRQSLSRLKRGLQKVFTVTSCWSFTFLVGSVFSSILGILILSASRIVLDLKRKLSIY